MTDAHLEIIPGRGRLEAGLSTATTTLLLRLDALLAEALEPATSAMEAAE